MSSAAASSSSNFEAGQDSTAISARRSTPAGRLFRRLIGEPSALLGLVLVVCLTMVGLFGPLLVPDSAVQRQLPRGFLPPSLSSGHLFGTDYDGRDILALTILGARSSLAIGVFVSLLSAAIGVVLGGLAGYFEGWFDTLMMRFVDLLLAFPRLILAIAILAVVQKPSLWLVFLVLSLTGWAGIARLVRAQAMQAKELEFIQAARALGAGHGRILLVHILPHIAGVIIIWTTLAIPATIMAEAGLSFLGLGAAPDEPSWGTMISETSRYLRVEWWMSLVPGAALAITVLGYNLLGDALQDALNPRLRKE